MRLKQMSQAPLGVAGLCLVVSGFAAFSSLALACTSAPAEPTWHSDVQDILVANCIKCHGRVTRGGAPSTIRLDQYGSASFVADYVAERTHQGTMPPLRPLSDNQIETLQNWASTGAPQGDPDPDNKPAVLVFDGFSGDEELVSSTYLITDPDFDIAGGSLVASPTSGAGNAITIGTLHSGAASIDWFIGSVAAGTYDLRATIGDGSSDAVFELGQFVVAHSDNNTAPTMRITSPLAGEVLADSRSPMVVTVNVADPDEPPNAMNTLGIALVRGDERVELGTITNAAIGPNTLDVDTTVLPAGSGWSVVVESGGAVARQPQLTVSHTTTALTFADVQPLLMTYCDRCHAAGGFFPLALNLASDYSFQKYLRPFQRAVLERTMPPTSAATLLDGYEPMPQAERDRLADWILGGAPGELNGKSIGTYFDCFVGGLFGPSDDDLWLC